MSKPTDTLITLISDMHSGGSTALFPHYKHLKKGFWQFKHNRYVPSGRQCDMFEHYDKCAIEVSKRRKGKRLVVVHDGDAQDGVHHNTNQLATRIRDEQTDVHIWLMSWLLNKTQFARNKGDRLYYVSGTETHTDDKEDRIAQELGAEQTLSGDDVYDFLPLEVNGRLLWFLHHGGNAGKGHTEGDALRNWLKRIYWQCVKDKRRVPDVIISGHVHTPAYSTYVQDYHTLHGIILPSWQSKTRYAYMVAPTDVNKVGMQTLEIKADGVIVIATPMLLNQVEEQVSI